METMIIPMDYYYKGSTNCYLTLKKNKHDDTISVITGYNETVATVTSGHALAKVLQDLDNGVYA